MQENAVYKYLNRDTLYFVSLLRYGFGTLVELKIKQSARDFNVDFHIKYKVCNKNTDITVFGIIDIFIHCVLI